jgi:hypothetical protein
MLKQILLIAALLTAPAFVVVTTLALRLDAGLNDCDPVGDDEFHYWDEIASFTAVGLHGGYFVADEEPANQSWTHFGPHGPVFPILYGSMARVLGWNRASGPVFNLVVLAAGSLVWLCLVRPNARHLAVVVFLWATFWACLLYVPSTMQECLNFAMAFVLAGCAHRTVNERDAGGWLFWPFLAVVVFASTLRITWTLVLPVWAVVAWPSLTRASRVAVVTVIAVVVPVLFALTRQVAGGYPNFVAAVSDLAWHDPLKAVAVTLSHIRQSASQLFSMSDLSLWTDRVLEVVLRIQTVAIIVLTGFKIAAHVGGARVSAQFSRFLWSVIAFAALVFAAQNPIGGILLTLAAGWFCWRKNGSWWPVLLTAIAVGGVYICRTDRYIAAMVVGEFGVDYATLALIALVVWLNRRLVGEGVRLAMSLPPLQDRELNASGTADQKPAIAGATEWLDPRRVISRVKQAVSVLPPEDLRPYLFAGLNLAAVLAVVMVVYDLQYFRDYRVIAPHLLMVLLVLATGSGWRWAVCVAALNFCFFPAYVAQFYEFHFQRINQPRVEEINLRPLLDYDPAADPWSNTVLCPNVRLANRVRVSPGIGICWGVQFFAGGSKPPVSIDSPYVAYFSRFNDRWLSRPTRSRYVVLAPKDAKKWEGCQLRLLEEFWEANLYLNLDFPDDASTAFQPSAGAATGSSTPP